MMLMETLCPDCESSLSPEELARAAIIQHVTDAFIGRLLTLDEMCAILKDVGADEIAQRFREADGQMFRTGPDSFREKGSKEL